MRLKKLAGILLSCTVGIMALAGCGTGSNEVDTQKPTTVGMIVNLNASEQAMNNMMERVERELGTTLSSKRTYVYYDNLNSMQMGLDSKSIDEMSTYKSVGNYLLGKNPDLEMVAAYQLKLRDSFCSAVRSDDNTLKKEIDQAILSMKDDGTMESLQKKYIFDLKKGEEPPQVDMPDIPGADTVKVAITGDLPPLDLVLANGEPAGFNTAVLAEISRRIGKNIEIVQVDSAARAAALTSGKADVIFWAIVPLDDPIRPQDIDKPEGVALTVPYFADEIVHLKLKK